MENQDDEQDGEESLLSRRQFVGAAGTATVGIASVGYLHWAGFFRSDEQHAKLMVESLEDDDLEVESWSISGDVLQLDYLTTGVASNDLELIGLAYADIVGDGFSLDFEATAVNSSTEWTFSIPRSLAQDYNSGPFDKGEYLDEIE